MGTRGAGSDVEGAGGAGGGCEGGGGGGGAGTALDEAAGALDVIAGGADDGASGARPSESGSAAMLIASVSDEASSVQSVEVDERVRRPLVFPAGSRISTRPSRPREVFVMTATMVLLASSRIGS